MANPRRVLAVVVTYLPEREPLLALLHALVPQVEATVVVDNTPARDERVQEWLVQDDWRSGAPRLIRLGDNRGIAAAQNVGLRIALEEGFDYVLLSDQDSLPSADMVAVLRQTCEDIQMQGVEVGCVCPEYFDRTARQAFPFQVQRPGRWFYSSVPGTEAVPWIEIITTISSGKLIPRAAIERVGFMREDFFIDDVDTEWCHRVRAAGLRNFGTALTRLAHTLGDRPFRVWWLGWRWHSEYSTTRLYYRFRNFVLMCRLSHVPWRWVVRASWYWAGNLYAHTLFAPRRLANARAILRGLWHGVCGRSGPLGL